MEGGAGVDIDPTTGTRSEQAVGLRPRCLIVVDERLVDGQVIGGVVDQEPPPPTTAPLLDSMVLSVKVCVPLSSATPPPLAAPLPKIVSSV